MAKRLRSIPPVIPHYPPENDRGAYAPQLWYGDEAVNAADGPWYDAPPGSIYVQGGTTTGGLYHKVADTGAVSDWQGITSTVNSTAGVFNVLDYGAVGDGVAEDAPALQAALDAAATAGGGTVYLPAGTYLVNTELQVKDNVSLIGQGIGVSVITTGATLPDGVIHLWHSGTGAGSGADNVTLRDFTLEANGTARLTAALGGYVRGIRSRYGPENLLIQRVKVNDGGERAIEIYQPINCRITDCIVTNASTVTDYEGDGIHVEGTSIANGYARNIIIDGCMVEKWGDSGIATPGCREVVIAHNTLRGKAAFSETPTGEETGIDMLGVLHGVCTGNKIYQVRNLGIGAFAFPAGAGFAAQNITISHNVLVGDAATCRDHGIKVGNYGDAEIAGCGNYTITGNVITNTYYPAIGVEGPCAGVTITGNTITDAMLEGDGGTPSDCAIMLGITYTADAANVLCSGNTIVDTGSHIDTGVYVNTGNTSNTVYGNHVYGTSVTAAVVWANGGAAPLLTADGRTIGATAQAQVFTNGIQLDADSAFAQDDDWITFTGIVASATAVHYAYSKFLRSRGTVASPTALEVGDIIGGVNFYGYNGAERIAAGLSASAETVGAATVDGSLHVKVYRAGAELQPLWLGSVAGVVINEDGDSAIDTRIEGDTDQFLIFADAGADKVGIGASTLEAKLHVDQSGAEANIPVLMLDQGDVDKPMIRFETTIGTGNAIEMAGSKILTPTHFIKCEIAGSGTVYIPCGTIAVP